MGRPSYDNETLAAYFYPMQPSLFDDPVCGAELRRLAVEDPDLIAAVADVDRTQVRDFLAKTPWQRLEDALGLFEMMTGFRRVP
jgi:hypothetical protein